MKRRMPSIIIAQCIMANKAAVQVSSGKRNNSLYEKITGSGELKSIRRGGCFFYHFIIFSSEEVILS
jgi:hypothetical protein